METRSELLQVIRRCSQFAKTAEDEDEALLLRAGIMPKETLRRIVGFYPTKLIESCGRKLIVSPRFIRANPSDRTRPIVTNYDIEKPSVSPTYRGPTMYRVFGRDRLALWYAAANNDYSGSRGEAYGLWLILKFWRHRSIQKAWRRFLDRPWKLPEDAR